MILPELVSAWAISLNTTQNTFLWPDCLFEQSKSKKEITIWENLFLLNTTQATNKGPWAFYIALPAG